MMNRFQMPLRRAVNDFAHVITTPCRPLACHKRRGVARSCGLHARLMPPSRGRSHAAALLIRGAYFAFSVSQPASAQPTTNALCRFEHGNRLGATRCPVAARRVPAQPIGRVLTNGAADHASGGDLSRPRQRPPTLRRRSIGVSSD